MSNAAQVQIGNDSHLRRVIATTLKNWFEKNVILETLCVADNLSDGAGTQNLGVIVLINSLAKHFGWSQQLKHDIRLQLYKNMLPKAKLDPDPERELIRFKEEYKNGPNSVNSTLSTVARGKAHNDDLGVQKHELVVFCQLIYSLRKILSGNYNSFFEVFHEEVKEELGELNISPRLEHWINHILIHTRGAILNVNISTDEMSSVVQAFYNAISESVGPIDADKIITLAIEKTEKIPAAINFSPRNFL